MHTVDKMWPWVLVVFAGIVWLTHSLLTAALVAVLFYLFDGFTTGLLRGLRLRKLEKKDDPR